MEITQEELNKLLKDVTRFEVIGKGIRLMVKYNVQVELSIQDEGRTLKVFVDTEDLT